MKIWFEVFSELYINLAAGWFALVFIEPQISGSPQIAIPRLTLDILAGILSLYYGKKFKEAAGKL